VDFVRTIGMVSGSGTMKTIVDPVAFDVCGAVETNVGWSGALGALHSRSVD
jgi:hypothetical protein